MEYIKTLDSTDATRMLLLQTQSVSRKNILIVPGYMGFISEYRKRTHFVYYQNLFLESVFLQCGNVHFFLLPGMNYGEEFTIEKSIDLLTETLKESKVIYDSILAMGAGGLILLEYFKSNKKLREVPIVFYNLSSSLKFNQQTNQDSPSLDWDNYNVVESLYSIEANIGRSLQIIPRKSSYSEHTQEEFNRHLRLRTPSNYMGIYDFGNFPYGDNRTFKPFIKQMEYFYKNKDY